ncbi:hypothetical protein [Aquimarina rhabdastrellae]
MLKVFCLYRLNKDKFLLIRANRPSYNNANQNQENKAEEILRNKIALLLKKYVEHKHEYVKPKLIGELQGLPEGVVLYEKYGMMNLQQLRYATTIYSGFIFLSIARNEEEFMAIISEDDFADNGLTQEDLKLPSITMASVDFITENDFDLSSIEGAYNNDLRE